MTSPTVSRQPTTPSEWQLYAVLQRANLLSYFETFISHGGDDVQQLIDAEKSEFLEIMSLMGMASKPLHVRRLQKVLNEFSNNPTSFHSPSWASVGLVTTPLLSEYIASVTQASVMPPSHSAVLSPSSASGVPGTESPTLSLKSDNWSSGNGELAEQSGEGGYNDSSPGPIPVLSDLMIQRLSEKATEMATNQPDFEPKMVQNKKKISKDLLKVLNMSAEEPNRLPLFRKYGAIYGRFDCKRKADKPLTLHEVSVNEAAAQICLHRPALLTRRDELFPLARQVVRDAGYPYAKPTGRLRSFDCDDIGGMKKRPHSGANSDFSQFSPSRVNGEGGDSQKRITGVDAELLQLSTLQDDCKRRIQQAIDVEELHKIHRELNHLTSRQVELTNEQANLTKRTESANRLRASDSGGESVEDEMDNDSVTSSNPTSPSSNGNHDVESFDCQNQPSTSGESDSNKTSSEEGVVVVSKNVSADGIPSDQLPVVSPFSQYSPSRVCSFVPLKFLGPSIQPVCLASDPHGIGLPPWKKIKAELSAVQPSPTLAYGNVLPSR